MKIKLDNKLSIGALLVSFFALVLSLLSYLSAQRALKIDEVRFSMLNTPTIIERSDSTHVSFSLDKGILQRVLIYFPRELRIKPELISSRPFVLGKTYLERGIENAVKKYNKPSDSTLFSGYVYIPVIIQYSCNILSNEETLRENRYFEFFFVNSNEYTSVSYSGSSLIQRVGYPIKDQFHWRKPFARVNEEIIMQRDTSDIFNFLDAQFEQTKLDLKGNLETQN